MSALADLSGYSPCSTESCKRRFQGSTPTLVDNDIASIGHGRRPESDRRTSLEVGENDKSSGRATLRVYRRAQSTNRGRLRGDDSK